MNQETWSNVDAYFCETLLADDPVLDHALRTSADAGLPAINVAPNQGKLLNLLATMCGARRILEIGTLGGYSTIWLARALPVDGQVITLELDPHHADVARQNIAHAGLDNVTIHVGKASETLPRLYQANPAPFDFIFIDADKPSNPLYLEWALKFARTGTVITVDNVVRNGAVLDADSDDPNVQGVRTVLKMMAEHPRLSSTALQTVGSKGYDGFALAVVLDDKT